MSERVIEWIGLSLNILSQVLFPPHAELVGWFDRFGIGSYSEGLVEHTPGIVRCHT